MQTPIIALSSLSPKPAQAPRQRKCVASWRAAGCSRVVAFQSAAELRDLGAWEGVEFVKVEPSAAWGGRFVPVSRLTTWAAAHPEVGHVAIFNADIEVECSAETLQSLAREAGEGLCFMNRFESDRGLPFLGGADAFLFPAASAHVVPQSEILAFARPHWDHVVPIAFLEAGLPVCCPVPRAIGHESHVVTSARPEDAARTAAEAARIFGRPIGRLEEFIGRTRYLGGATDHVETERELATLFGQKVWPPVSPPWERFDA